MAELNDNFKSCFLKYKMAVRAKTVSSILYQTNIPSFRPMSFPRMAVKPARKTAICNWSKAFFILPKINQSVRKIKSHPITGWRKRLMNLLYQLPEYFELALCYSNRVGGGSYFMALPRESPLYFFSVICADICHQPTNSSFI